LIPIGPDHFGIINLNAIAIIIKNKNKGKISFANDFKIDSSSVFTIILLFHKTSIQISDKEEFSGFSDFKISYSFCFSDSDSKIYQFNFLSLMTSIFSKDQEL
jgi:hypothetical protein